MKNAGSIYKLPCVPLNIASVLRILCSKQREKLGLPRELAYASYNRLTHIIYNQNIGLLLHIAWAYAYSQQFYIKMGYKQILQLL